MHAQAALTAMPDGSECMKWWAPEGKRIDGLQQGKDNVLCIRTFAASMHTALTLDIKSYQLQFRHPFGIAHGIRSHTDTLFVRAGFMEQYGYGEAALPPYLGYHVDELARDFHRHFPAKMEGADAIRQAMQQLQGASSLVPVPLRTAVDMAMYDLFAQLTGRTVRQLFEIPEPSSVLCSYTLGFASVEETVERIREAGDFRLFKVKLGSVNDKERIEAMLAEGARTFCVDANQAWTSVQEALVWMDWLQQRNCLFVEQPLPVLATSDYAALYKSAPLPVFLDESVQNENDVETLRGVCHGINVKLVKCGGLEKGVRMVRLANKYGLKVLIGCMSESTCGAMAAAQLSGWADYVDLDGPRLIANDPFSGASYNAGKLLLSSRPGTGAVLENAGLFAQNS